MHIALLFQKQAMIELRTLQLLKPPERPMPLIIVQIAVFIVKMVAVQVALHIVVCMFCLWFMENFLVVFCLCELLFSKGHFAYLGGISTVLAVKVSYRH